MQAAGEGAGYPRGAPRDAGWALLLLLLLPWLRALLSALPPGFKCPICSKSVASDEMEMHFIMCLSKPRLSYNGKGAGRAGGTLGQAGAAGLPRGLRSSCRPRLALPALSLLLSPGDLL